MSESNGQLIYKASTGALYHYPTTQSSSVPGTKRNRLLYGASIPLVDHQFYYSAMKYGIHRNYNTYYSDYPGDNDVQRLADLNDSTYRPTFLPLTFDSARYVRSAKLEYTNGWSSGEYELGSYYYTCCLKLDTSSAIADPSTIQSVKLDIACGRLFSDYPDDDFDEDIWAVGVLSDSESAYTTTQQVINNAQFRLNVAECQRVTRTLTSLGKCYSNQSGHATGNSFSPLQTVQIDEVVPYLKQLQSIPELYLYMAIDAPIPANVPILAYTGSRFDKGVVACPDRLHIYTQDPISQ